MPAAEQVGEPEEYVEAAKHPTRKDEREAEALEAQWSNNDSRLLMLLYLCLMDATHAAIRHFCTGAVAAPAGRWVGVVTYVAACQVRRPACFGDFFFLNSWFFINNIKTIWNLYKKKQLLFH